MQEPIKGPARLVFTLEQQHGGGDLIGRARLASASETPSATVQPIPARVQQALAKPKAERTEAEQDEMPGTFSSRGWTPISPPCPRCSSSMPLQATSRPMAHSKADQGGAEAKPGALSMLPGLDRHFQYEKELLVAKRSDRFGREARKLKVERFHKPKMINSMKALKMFTLRGIKDSPLSRPGGPLVQLESSLQ